MAEDYTASFLPKTLKVLSLNLNRLRLEKYKVDGTLNMTGIEYLYPNQQEEAS